MLYRKIKFLGLRNLFFLHGSLIITKIFVRYDALDGSRRIASFAIQLK